MNVLSVFDGISAGRLALERACIKIDKYYRSEIDKYANQVAIHHYPSDIQLGDITKWREWNIDWSSIDLFIGGSPCQGFSFAGKQAGTKACLDGTEILVTDRETYLELKSKGAEFLSQSHLFWEYVLILDHIKKHNPNVKFLLENVKMRKELLRMISDSLGVEDIVINSNLVSAQNRHRHYWCNWKVEQPKDKGVLLKDILVNSIEPEFFLSKDAIDYMSRLRNGRPRWEYHKSSLNGKSAFLTANMYKGVPYGVLKLDDSKICRATVQKNAEHTDGRKSPTLTASMGVGGGNVPLITSSEIGLKFKGMYLNENDRKLYRRLTPTECARLQTFPDGWCENIVSKTQAYKAYGNSWTVDVIAHIFSSLR